MVYYFKGPRSLVQQALDRAEAEGLSVKGSVKRHQVTGNVLTMEAIARTYRLEIHKVQNAVGRFVKTTYRIEGKLRHKISMKKALAKMHYPNWKGKVYIDGNNLFITVYNQTEQEVLFRNCGDYGLRANPVS